MPDQFIEKCKQEIAGYQSMLAPLEAGEIRSESRLLAILIQPRRELSKSRP